MDDGVGCIIKWIYFVTANFVQEIVKIIKFYYTYLPKLERWKKKKKGREDIDLNPHIQQFWNKIRLQR